MKMEYAASPGEALERALAAKGKDARIAVIPNGVSVVVKRR
jgi:nickel-dependent lactate racemase